MSEGRFWLRVVLVSVVVLPPFMLALLMKDLWMEGEFTEATDERIMSCTVIDMTLRDTVASADVAITAECGELVVPTDSTIVLPQFRNALDHSIKVGHTYRLVIGEVDPPIRGTNYQQIVRVIAVED